eukprot:224399-Lingulodinium_polyedra.AAC.1
MGKPSRAREDADGLDTGVVYGAPYSGWSRAYCKLVGIVAQAFQRLTIWSEACPCHCAFGAE